MIRAPRTIAIVKRIFMFPFTDENSDRTTSLESYYTLIVSKEILKRWFCSIPSSTQGLVEYEESKMGLGESGQSGIKLRAKRRLFLLTLME